MHMRFFIATFAILAATACTTIPEDFQNHPLLSGRSDQYAQGFFDGVRTGRHITGHYLTIHTVDVHRYRRDEEYREGWDDGVHAVIDAAQ